MARTHQSQKGSAGYVNFPYQQLRRIGVSEAKAMAVASKVVVRSYAQNAILCNKGGRFESLFMVVNGLIAASVETADEHNVPISLHGNGAWFGTQEIFSNKQSYANYVCLTPAELLTLPASLVVQLLDSEQGFAKHAIRMMAWRAQRASETLILMKLGNPYLRVVMGIAQLIEALSYRSDRPATISFEQSIQVPLTQSTIAALCGVSRSSFSEVLQQLVHHDWVRVSYGTLEVLSCEVWSKFAKKQRDEKISTINPSLSDLMQNLSEQQAIWKMTKG